MMYILSILFSILLTQSAFAASYYVATTGNDSNLGTQGSPWLTIQKAANTVVAGDTVFIRGGTYASGSLIGLVTSGTPNNLITWKPEPSTGTPIIRYSGAKQYDHGIIEGFDISYNRFEGITFGGPSGSLTDQAIKFYATNTPDFNTTHSLTRGNQIVGNTFQKVGHDGTGGVAYGGIISAGSPEDMLVDSNTFVDNYSLQIVMAGGYNNTITNNNISALHGAQLYGDFVYPVNANGIWVSSSASTWTPGSTLKIAGYTLVKGNYIDGGGGGIELSGIRCDAGAHNMTIENNFIKDLGTTNDTGGIYLESRCRHNTVTQNVVVNSNRGIILSSPSIGSTQYDSIIGNTFYGNAQGVHVNNAGNEVIANNIGAENTLSQIVVSETSVAIGSITLRNNLWFKTGSSNIGQWNCADFDCYANPATQTLSAFDSASGETGAVGTDPLFVAAGSNNFNLTSSSPAINTGSATYSPLYNSSAPDIGAYERFTVSSCEVGAVATNKLVCNFGMNLNQPIRIINTTGWSWTGGTISSVAVTGNTQLTFTLSSAYGGGASTITYTETTGNATDSILIGNTYNQRLSGITTFAVTDNTGGVVARGSTGYFVRTDCGGLSSPISNGAVCIQRSTTSGRTAGVLYRWNGAAWIRATNRDLENFTVATLPTSNLNGDMVIVTDSTTPSSCLSGGGTAHVVCVWNALLGTWLSTGVTDHGLLSGLANDDHTQYSLGTVSTGPPAPGICSRKGQLFFDDTTSTNGSVGDIYFCSGGSGTNAKAFSLLGDVYNNITGDSGAASASGSDTLKISGGTGLTVTCINGSPDTCTMEVDSAGISVAKVASPLKTKTITFRIGSDQATSVLANTDDETNMWTNDLAAMHVTQVRCSSDAGTPIINLERDDGSAANILSSDLTCATGRAGATSSSFTAGEDAIALGHAINFKMVTAGGTAKRVTITITATLD